MNDVLKSVVSGIIGIEGNNLICRIENNGNIPQTRAAADDLNVQHIGDRNNYQHKNFLCNALCTDLTGKLLLYDRNDNLSDIP